MRRTNGKKGEQNCQNLITGLFDAKILSTNDDGRWDFEALIDDKPLTFEVKTNPDAFKYGGFSVEIAHKQNSYISSYITREAFIWDNTKVVKTGLAESKADFYIFHDNKKQYYLVKSKDLKDWANNIVINAKHRVRWGGYENHTLNIQIRFEELGDIGMHIDTRKKPGRKSATEDKA